MSELATGSSQLLLSEYISPALIAATIEKRHHTIPTPTLYAVVAQDTIDYALATGELVAFERATALVDYAHKRTAGLGLNETAPLELIKLYMGAWRARTLRQPEAVSGKSDRYYGVRQLLGRQTTQGYPVDSRSRGASAEYVALALINDTQPTLHREGKGDHAYNHDAYKIVGKTSKLPIEIKHTKSSKPGLQDLSQICRINVAPIVNALLLNDPALRSNIAIQDFRIASSDPKLRRNAAFAALVRGVVSQTEDIPPCLAERELAEAVQYILNRRVDDFSAGIHKPADSYIALRNRPAGSRLF